MKVAVQGMILEVKTVLDDVTDEIKNYEMMIFQPGERENLVISTKKNGVKPGQQVLATGRLSINVWKGRPYVKLFAEELEVVGESPWSQQQ